jgi:hypothetical protein
MWIHLLALGLIDGASSAQVVAPAKGGGLPAYYFYDSEEEAKNRAGKQYPKAKKKAVKVVASPKAEPETNDLALSSQFVKATNTKPSALVVDKGFQGFLAEQELIAKQFLVDLIEEEELAICLMM